MRSPFFWVAIVLCVLLLLAIRAECIWERLGGAAIPAGYTLILLLGVGIFAILVGSTVVAFRRDPGERLSAALLPVVCALALLDAVYNPFGLSCEAFLSPIVERACYEGTVNFATVKLRADHGFEVQAVGPFAFSEYHAGTWRREADTLRLDFDGRRPERYSAIYVVAFDSLSGDSLWSPAGGGIERGPTFYEGYCKGLN